MKKNSIIQFIVNRNLNKFWILFRRATLVALLFLSKNNLIAESFNVRALWVVRDFMTTPEKIDELVE